MRSLLPACTRCGDQQGPSRICTGHCRGTSQAQWGSHTCARAVIRDSFPSRRHRVSKWEQALQRLQWITQENSEPHPSHFGTIIGACAKARLWARTLKLLEVMHEQFQSEPGLGVWVYNLAISAHTGKHHWAGALALLTEMVQSASRPDVVTCNSLVNVCTQNEQWTRAVCLIARLQGSSVESNVITHNTLLTTQKRGRSWQEALLKLDGMSQDAIEPNRVTHNTAISALSGLQLPTWAWAVWWFARSACSAAMVDLVACNAVVTSCSEGQQWSWALTFFQTVCRSTLQRDVITYSAAICAMDRGGQWSRALQLFGRQELAGVKPNLIACGTVINALTRSARWAWGVRLLQATRKRGHEPSLAVHSAVLSVLSAGLQWERALRLPLGLRSCGVEADGPIWSGVMSACTRRRRWEQALELVPRVLRRPGSAVEGSVQVLSACNAAVSACEAAWSWERAVWLLRAAQCRAISPNAITYSSAISACQKPARWEWASRLLGVMWREEAVPGLIAYGGAVGACGCSQQWERAVLVLRCIRLQDLKPDTLALEAVVSACEGSSEARHLPSLCDELRDCAQGPGATERPSTAPPAWQPRSAGGAPNEAALRTSAVESLDWLGLLDEAAARNFRRREGEPVLHCLRSLLVLPGEGGSTARDEWTRLHDTILERIFSTGGLICREFLRDVASGDRSPGCRWQQSARLPARRLALRVPSKNWLSGPLAGLLSTWTAHTLPGTDNRERAVGAGDAPRQAAQSLLPVFVEHDRSGHSERLALAAVLAQLAV